MGDVRSDLKPEKVIGRYALFGAIARGGMATVHLGRLIGPVGFTKPVAIKRLHAHLSSDPQFTTMFLDEARLAARISHPNVVPTLDVVALEGELFLVMEYVHGESLAQLMRLVNEKKNRIKPEVAVNIMSGALQGLHAAHEATMESGEPLNIVHRDFTPQNIIVGADGVARVLDFGVAKAMGQAHTTREGQLKGKLKYMAPEQIGGLKVTRQTDVFSASVVLWEMLTGRQLFEGENDGELLYKVMEAKVEPPSSIVSGLPRDLDRVVLKGLERDREKRWASALDMTVALEKALSMVTQREVSAWVAEIAGHRLDKRKKRVLAVETSSSAPGREIDIRKTLSDSTEAETEAETESGPTELTSTGATVVVPSEELSRPAGHVAVRPSHLLGGAAAMLVVGAVAVWALSGDGTETVAPAGQQSVALSTVAPSASDASDPTSDPDAQATASAAASATAALPDVPPTATTAAKKKRARTPPPPPAPPPRTRSDPDPSQFSRD